MRSVAMRELARNKRLLRLSVCVADQPGVLSTVATVIGQAGANILEIGHDRLALDQTAKGAVLDVLAEVQDAQHGERLAMALASNGMGVRQTNAAVR